MAKTATINVRMEPTIKKQAEVLFSSFGITLSDAFNLFACQAVYEQAIPFQITRRLPNAETLAAFDECEAMVSGKLPKPKSMPVDELFAGMRSNDEI
ncbi:hypothetical protein FACS1894111_07100 [Clostridia bacterium]|nr:hypothetical protein FACS1894111_07100 [Clostridia bacterium]